MIEMQIDTMIQRLPISLKREVLDFVEFLSRKHYGKPRAKKEFKFDWEGGLADIGDKTTSVELQHKAMDWR